MSTTPTMTLGVWIRTVLVWKRWGDKGVEGIAGIVVATNMIEEIP